VGAAIERSRSEQTGCLSGEATHGAHTKLEEDRQKSQEEQGEADVMRAEETSSAMHNTSKREKRKQDSSRRRVSKPGEVGPQKYQTAATTTVVLPGARVTVASHVPAHMFPCDPPLGSHVPVPAASSKPRVVGVDAALLEKKRRQTHRTEKHHPRR